MQRHPFTLVHVLLLILLVMVGGVFLFPIVTNPGHGSPRTACLSQVKQLATSMMIYVMDYDDRFPPKAWDAELKPYHKNDYLLTCTELIKHKKQWGYAMNLAVMGVDSAKMPDPQKTVLFFETDALARGVVANLAARSLTRHGKGADAGSNVSYCDSSAKFKKGPEKL